MGRSQWGKKRYRIRRRKYQPNSLVGEVFPTQLTPLEALKKNPYHNEVERLLQILIKRQQR